TFDIIDGKGKVIVEKGRRITARHINQLEKAGVSSLEVPFDYLIGRTIAKPVVHPATGEILVEYNTEISAEQIEKLIKAGVTQLATPNTYDIDSGPFISVTLRIDTTTSQVDALVEIYRRMHPGEPPTKGAAESLYSNLFFSSDRYD